MTTNPWERLREAALRLTRSVNKLVHPLHDNALRRNTMHSVDAVQEALAALPATPPQQPVPDAKVADLLAENARLRAEIGALESRVPDEERERAIELWIHRIAAARFNNDTVAFDRAVQDGCDLMRSAPVPQPVPAPPASDWRTDLGVTGNIGTGTVLP